MLYASKTSRSPDPASEQDHDSDALRDEMMALVHHITAIAAAIDQAILRELQSIDQESAGSTVVIDDITPAYRKASAALRDCLMLVGTALECLTQAEGPSGPVQFGDALGRNAAPGVDDRQPHRGLCEVREADPQGGEVDRLRQALQVDPE